MTSRSLRSSAIRGEFVLVDMTFNLALDGDVAVGGDLLEGVLRLTSQARLARPKVVIRVGWRSVTGDATHGDVLPVTLECPPLEPGQPCELPFRVGLPNGPATFAAADVGVRWFVRADLKKAGRSATAEHPFTLVRSADPALPVVLGHGDPPPDFFTPRGWGAQRVPGWVAPLTGIAISLATLGIVTRLELPLALAILGALLGMGTVSLVSAWRTMRARSAFSALRFDAPAQHAAGQPLTTEVQFQPHSASELVCAEVVVQCVESVTTGSQRNRTTGTLERSSHACPLHGIPSSLRSGATYTGTTHLEIPAEASPTMWTAGSEHALTWWVTARLQLAGGPLVECTKRVEILPPPGGPAAPPAR